VLIAQTTFFLEHRYTDRPTHIHKVTDATDYLIPYIGQAGVV